MKNKLEAVVKRLIHLTCAEKIWWEIDNQSFPTSDAPQLNRKVYTTWIKTVRVRIKVTTIKDYTDYSVDFSKAGRKATKELRLEGLKELVDCITRICFSETDTMILLKDFLDTEITE
jgi:hypothetical protein